MKVKIISLNQAEVERDNGVRVLISYGTPVAAFVPGTGYRTGYCWTQEELKSASSRHVCDWIPEPFYMVPQSFLEELMKDNYQAE